MKYQASVFITEVEASDREEAEDIIWSRLVRGFDSFDIAAVETESEAH